MNHVSAFLIADHVIGALLNATTPGLVVSIDVGGSLFDTVARTAAKSSFHEFAEIPSLARHRSQRFGRTVPLKPSDVIEEAALFGRTDGKTQRINPDIIFETYGSATEQISTCSIDGWIAGRSPARYIHFGDPELTIDQLAGASETLRRDRPIATFYAAGTDRRALLSQIERHAYTTFNLGMQPVEPGPPQSESDFGWIAVPSERSGEAIAATPREARVGIAQFSEWHELIERNSTMRQHSSRAVFGFPPNTPQLLHTYSASEIIVEDDCYPAESDGTSSWRWFGPRPRTRVSLPCLLPGIYQLEITVIACHLRSGIAACRVLVDGREVRATVQGTEAGSIRFLGQVKPEDYAGFLCIDVVSPGTVSMIGADPRTLRLSVQSISVSPWR
ncbi:MAG: hypothetical protein ABSD74_20630 [Rhizomicrobium sp.]